MASVNTVFFKWFHCFLSDKKKSFAGVISFSIIVFLSFLATFAISRFIPSSEKTNLYITIKDVAGETILEDKDVEDIQIYYATEDDPVFSERLRISKEEILSSNPAIINQKHEVQLPNSIIRIRLDIAFADTVELEDDVYPEVKIKINKARFYGSPQKLKSVLMRKTDPNRYSFEIGDKDVIRNRTPYSWRIFFTLFFLSMAVVSLFLKFVKSYPKLVFILAFLSFSIFPNIKFNLEKTSATENRNLATFPQNFAFDSASSYFSQVEQCYNDRFFGRFFLSGISDEIKVFFDDRGSERVMKGDDEWLFTMDSLPETKISWGLDDEKMEHAGKYLNAISEYAASKGKQFIYVICPDKFRIYGDKLSYYPPTSYLEDNVVDRFVDYLRKHYDFPVIYQRKELLQKRLETDHVLYFKYDTHWTGEGAYYGLYQPVLNALSIPPIPVDHWKQKEKKDGDLISVLFSDSRRFLKLESHQYFEPAFNKKATTRLIEDIHNPYSGFEIVLSSNPDGIPKNVLFLRDSYMNAVIDCFANTFQEEVFIWRPYPLFYESDLDYINQSDIIVLEQVERLVYRLMDLEFDLEK